MGKKKSKIAKKIQATKKFGGLLVQKGGVKHRSDPSSTTLKVTAIASATMTAPAPTKHKRQRQFVKPNSSTMKTPIERTIVNNDQDNKKKKMNQDDFESQMKSLQERAAHSESNATGSTRRGGRSNRTAARNKTIIQLAPASFIIDDKLKSTDRLVQETTHKMELGWSSWDKTVPSAPHHQHLFASANIIAATGRTLLQEAAKAQHRMAWTDESPLENTDDNLYAALQQDDDDDDADNDNNDHDRNNGQSQRDKPPKLQQLFQFAPPSFHFQGSNNNNNGDWDPDL